jgi:hypothetical protein
MKRQHRGENPAASPSSSELTKTDVEREEVRSWIKQQMQRCELSAEPENLKEERRQLRHTKPGDCYGRGAHKKTTTQNDVKDREGSAHMAVTIDVADAFFGEDDEADIRMDEDEEETPE